MAAEPAGGSSRSRRPPPSGERLLRCLPPSWGSLLPPRELSRDVQQRRPAGRALAHVPEELPILRAELPDPLHPVRQRATPRRPPEQAHEVAFAQLHLPGGQALIDANLSAIKC